MEICLVCGNLVGEGVDCGACELIRLEWELEDVDGTDILEEWEEDFGSTTIGGREYYG